MTTRERWIVYPLLFLTLGIALRDKIIPSSVKATDLTAQKIQCNQLEVGQWIRCPQMEAGNVHCRGIFTVANPKGEERIRIGVTPGKTGRLELCGQDGKPAVVIGAGKRGRSGMIETFSDKGAPLVQIHSTDGGGIVTTVDREQKVLVAVGHDTRNSGLLGVDSGRPIPLILPYRRGSRQPKAPAPKDPPPKDRSSP